MSVLSWVGGVLFAMLSFFPRMAGGSFTPHAFLPLLGTRVTNHTPVGPERSWTWESSPAPGLSRVPWREWRFRGDQPEDDSGELTSKATNLEFCEISVFSNAVSVVFCTAQAKWNTYVSQIQSSGSQCAASDGWALLFAFRVSSFISSLKDLFQQLLNECLWCSRKCSVPKKSIRGEKPLSPLSLRDSCPDVELRCGTERHSSTTSYSLLNLPLSRILTVTHVRL